jgi:hypothetical protein
VYDVDFMMAIVHIPLDKVVKICLVVDFTYVCKKY